MNSDKVRGSLRKLFNVRKGRASYKVIRKRVVEGAEIDGIHLCQLIAAMIIASIGLNVDSTEAVIGAMLICPLMGSVLAMAYGISTIDKALFREALIGILVQIGVCLCTSTLYFVISPLSNTTSELLTNSSPTIWDVLIAFVGGFAGALGISRKQEPSTLIAGVAVATALMPPLCSTGYGVSLKDWALAASALYEFLINVVFIAFGSELALVWLRVPLQSDLDGDGVVTESELVEAVSRSRSLRFKLIIGSLLFAIPCLFFSHRIVKMSMEDNGSVFETFDAYETEFTTRELKTICPELVSYRIGSEDSYNLDSNELEQRVVATVETTEEIDDELKKQMTDLIELNVEDVAEVTFEVLEG